MIAAAAGGADVAEAVAAGAAAAPRPDVRAGIEDAVASARGGAEDTAAYAGRVGRACHMKWCVPVAVHAMLSGGGGFVGAVRASALAGGESCGRGLLIGAVMGAAVGVPAGWRLRAVAAAAGETAARAIAEKRA